jgi:hypothetical protein
LPPPPAFDETTVKQAMLGTAGPVRTPAGCRRPWTNLEWQGRERYGPCPRLSFEKPPGACPPGVLSNSEAMQKLRLRLVSGRVEAGDACDHCPMRRLEDGLEGAACQAAEALYRQGRVHLPQLPLRLALGTGVTVAELLACLDGLELSGFRQIAIDDPAQALLTPEGAALLERLAACAGAAPALQLSAPDEALAELLPRLTALAALELEVRLPEDAPVPAQPSAALAALAAAAAGRPGWRLRLRHRVRRDSVAEIAAVAALARRLGGQPEFPPYQVDLQAAARLPGQNERLRALWQQDAFIDPDYDPAPLHAALATVVAEARAAGWGATEASLAALGDYAETTLARARYARRALGLARRLLAGGATLSALRCLDTLAPLPWVPEAHFLTGLCLVVRGEWQRAVAHIEHAQRLQPFNPAYSLRSPAVRACSLAASRGRLTPAV